MVRSCIPNLTKLAQLFSFYTASTTSPEVLQQQACDLSTIPYPSWKPPTCPQKCPAVATPKQSLHYLSRKDPAQKAKVTFGGFAEKRTTAAYDDLGASARTPPNVTAKDAHGGTASCVSLTRSHRMASQDAPDAVHRGPADDGDMTAALPAHRRRPRARLEIAPAVANAYALNRYGDVDGDQGPFDDMYELSSFLDEGEDCAVDSPCKLHTVAPVVAPCSPGQGHEGSGSSSVTTKASESPEASIAAPRVVEKEGSEDTPLGHVFFF
ncbi:hypothetical protein G6514_005276 [Epicoccum nigrum]|nr:hypothetical protein G6514_005276 [Epicoccum nigrum]